MGAIFEAARTWAAISIACAFVKGSERVPLISADPAKWLDSMAGVDRTVPSRSIACSAAVGRIGCVFLVAEVVLRRIPVELG
jgi:hypothetical protein